MVENRISLVEANRLLRTLGYGSRACTLLANSDRFDFVCCGIFSITQNRLARGVGRR